MERGLQKLPLPETAHIPGINPRPDLMFLESVSAYALAVTDEKHWKTNLPWLYGLKLFNNGFYWEAHEVWETVWMNAPPNSPEKQFVQGVIHFANGLLKIRMSRPKAALKLFALSTQDIEQAVLRRAEPDNQTYMGLVLADLRKNLVSASGKDPKDMDISPPNYVL
jgi:hypothetical protein